MEILLIGILLLVGLIFGTLGSHYFGVPRVVGYILIGMLFAPALLGDWLGMTDTDWTQPLVSVALGIIAYVIGGAISLGQLRRLGWSIVGATLGEVSGAFLAVLGAVLLLGVTVADLPLWSFALVLAAIAPATAPAAIVAVVHQFRARGQLTTTLLGMVAIDDALGILIFALVLAAVGSESLGAALGTVFWEIGAALLVGGLGGFLIERLSRRLHEQSMLLPLLLGGGSPDCRIGRVGRVLGAAGGDGARRLGALVLWAERRATIRAGRGPRGSRLRAVLHLCRPAF